MYYRSSSKIKLPNRISSDGNYIDAIWCLDYPYFWPYWFNGDSDFRLIRNQPFAELKELRTSTMLEF